MSKPTVYIFVHPPKCAGTTVCSVLSKQFGNRYKYINSYKGWIEIWKMAQQWRKGIDYDFAVAGHHTWGIHDLLPHNINYTYFTILRHPARIILSDYFFSQRLFYDTGDIVQFAETYPQNPLISCLGNGSIDVAKKRLAEVYKWFGIVERFEDSMLLLAHTLGVDELTYGVKNRSRLQDAIPSEEDFLSIITKRHARDIELYSWALSLFEKRLRRHARRETGQIAIHFKPEKADQCPTSENIVAFFAMGDNKAGLRSLEAWPGKQAGHMRALAYRHHRLGNTRKAEYWYTKAFEKNAAVCLDLMALYKESDPQRCRMFIDTIIRELSELPSDTQDSYLNLFRARCLSLLPQEN